MKWSCERCWDWSCTTRPSTSCTTRRKSGATRRPFKRPLRGSIRGTAYFAALVKHFGGAHLALASYNAGQTRVVRWMAERPNVDRDQFIDDIPFPETQNYVKKILGTADDYRHLYGSDPSRVDEDVA